MTNTYGWKIVGLDAQQRESVSDKIIAQNIDDLMTASILCEAANRQLQSMMGRVFIVREEYNQDYEAPPSAVVMIDPTVQAVPQAAEFVAHKGAMPTHMLNFTAMKKCPECAVTDPYTVCHRVGCTFANEIPF